MFQAFFRGSQIIRLLIIAAGLCLWIYTWINNSLHYKETSATVERIEEACTVGGVPTDCNEAFRNKNGKRPIRRRAIVVRYTSPADGRQYVGSIIPIGGDKAVEASRLQPGDHWSILAHNSKPSDIKAD